jgi:hypothetical protein
MKEVIEGYQATALLKPEVKQFWEILKTNAESFLNVAFRETTGTGLGELERSFKFKRMKLSFSITQSPQLQRKTSQQGSTSPLYHQ